MTTLFEMPANAPDPVHLLLIAKSKVGKSTYVAQAAKDGMTVLYIDADNGLSALRNHLRDDQAAQARVHYIATKHLAMFLDALLNSRGQFEWNMTEDKRYNPLVDKGKSQILCISPTALLREHDFILAVDSWTSCAADAMNVTADRLEIDLADADKANQSVYGGAFHRLNRILQVMQHLPFHTCVLAHGAYYERYEKPAGRVKDNKQSDMILKETLEVPLSSSRPHGVELPKFFNHVAWLELDRVGRVRIDFTRAYDRVGGGPPNRIAPVDELGFSKLLSTTQRESVKSDAANVIPAGAIYTTTAHELQTARRENQKVKPAARVEPGNERTQTTGVKATGVSRPPLPRLNQVKR